ncbi:MAG: hypothetical protein ACW98D_14020 [Promethearchaeota archaeon]|jgi:hypothetical protein
MPPYGKKSKKQTLEQFIDNLSEGRSAEDRLDSFKKRFLTAKGKFNLNQSNLLITLVKTLVENGFETNISGITDIDRSTGRPRTKAFLNRSGVKALYNFIRYLIDENILITTRKTETIAGVKTVTEDAPVSILIIFARFEPKQEKEEKKQKEKEEAMKIEAQEKAKAKKKAEEQGKSEKKAEKKAERAEKSEQKQKEKEKERETLEKSIKLSEAQILVAQAKEEETLKQEQMKQDELNELRRQQVLQEQSAQPAQQGPAQQVQQEEPPLPQEELPLPVDELIQRFGNLYDLDRPRVRLMLNALLTNNRDFLEATIENYNNNLDDAGILEDSLENNSENWKKLRDWGSKLYDLVIKLIEMYKTKGIKNLDGLFDEPKEAGPAIQKIIKGFDEQKQDKPDKKNDKEVVDNVELVQAVQVPQEQSFEQQVQNDKSQEKQLKAQINKGAEVIAQAEIRNDNDVNEVVMNMPEQVEIVQFDSDDVIIDMFQNDENKTAEILQGNPMDQGVLPAQPDPMIKSVTLLREIRDILTKLKKANRPEELSQFEKLLDTYIDLKDEYGEFNRVDETDEIRKEVNFLIKSIRALLSAKTENTFRLINARRKKREAERAETLLSQAQEKLSKVNKALSMIRSRVLNDGLLRPSPLQVQIEPNEETELIRESFEEIDQDIRENGVNDANLSNFINIMRIVQQDTYSVVTSAIRNDPSILVNPSGFAVGVGGSLLMRVLGRFLYSETEIGDNEELSTARVEAFYTDGNLQGTNPSIRQRLLNALRDIVPVPPSLSERVERESFQVSGESKEESREEFEKRTLIERKRRKGLRKRISDKIAGVFRSLPPTSATDPPLRDFRGFLEDLQSVVRSDINESNNIDKIISFYTSELLFVKPPTERDVRNQVLKGLNPSQIQAFAEAIEQELVNPKRVQLFADSRADVSELFVEIKRVSSPKTIKERIREWIAKQIQRGKRFKRFQPRQKRRVEVSPNAEALSRRFSGEDAGVELEDIVIEEPEIKDGGEEFKEQQRTAIEKLRETIVLGARAFLTTGSLRSREGLSMMTEKITDNIESLAKRAPDVRNYLRSATPSSIDNLISNTVSRLVGLANAAGSLGSSITPETLSSTTGGAIVGGTIGVAISLALSYALYSAIQYLYSGEEQQLDEPIFEERKLERGKTTEFIKGEEKPVSPEDIDKPQGEPLLRPEFNMTGIDFFNKAFNITPLDVQNSEWAEFDYAKKIDIQNLIEIDNALNDKIRFSGNMFYPEYVKPLKPPSNDAVILGRTGMIDQIQLTQQFAPKFDGAVTIFDNLSNTKNHDAFSRSWEDNILYNKDRM